METKIAKTFCLFPRRWRFGEGLAEWEMLGFMVKLGDVDRWKACPAEWRKLEAASPGFAKLAGMQTPRRLRRLRMMDCPSFSLSTFSPGHSLSNTDPRASFLVNIPFPVLVWGSSEDRNLSNVLCFLEPQGVCMWHLQHHYILRANTKRMNLSVQGHPRRSLVHLRGQRAWRLVSLWRWYHLPYRSSMVAGPDIFKVIKQISVHSAERKASAFRFWQVEQ